MSGKKCPNCGACKECGAHPPQMIQYPVYPYVPYRPPNWIPGTYPGTNPLPFGQRWSSGSSSGIASAPYRQTYNA